MTVEFEVNGKVVDARDMNEDQVRYETVRFKRYAERNGLSWAVYIRKRSKGNNNRPVMTISDINRAASLRSLGLTWDKIGEEMRLNPDTVRRSVRDYSPVK